MKKVKYYLLVASLAFIASSCSNSGADENSVEDKTEEHKPKGILINSIVLEPAKFEHFVEISGIVEADRNVVVGAEVPGILTKTVVSEGQKVAKGQTLAYLSSDVIESGIEELESSLELARTIFEKRKKLWDQKIGSELEYLQAKTNKESLEKKLQTLKSQKDQAIITSPIDGTVEEIYTNEGELISPGVPFALVVNLSTVKVRADVSEAYIRYVRKGDSLTIKFPAIGVEYNKKISRVGNVINPNSRTFPIEVEIDNRDGMIKLNAICMVRFRDYFREAALSVPSEIVQQDARGYYVYRVHIDSSHTTARKTYVDIGKTAMGITEVVDGLKDDERIITDGHNEVRDGAKIVLNN